MSLSFLGIYATPPSSGIPDDPVGTIYLADEGAKSLKVSGTISSGTNQFVADDVTGWNVADWVIIPTGSYTRGQVGPGGAHPNASAAGVANMSIPVNGSGVPIADRRSRDTSDGNRSYTVLGNTGTASNGSNVITSIGATDYTVGGKILLTGTPTVSAGTTITAIEADGANTLRLSNNVSGSGAVTLYGFIPVDLGNTYEAYCQPRPALVKISAINSGTKTFTLTDRSGGAWTAAASYTGDVYYDNIQVFATTIEATQGHYKLPLGNDIGISRNIRISTHTLDDGSLFGHGRTQSRLVVPAGCPCIVLELFEIDGYTARDFAYQANHAQVGYGLYWANYHADSESPDELYTATHYAVIQTGCDGNTFERIDGADVFTGASSSRATSNSITRDMTYTHNYPMEKYYQWHFQHANGDHNLVEDITVYSPNAILASYESFQGTSDIFRRITGPIIGAMNSAGDFTAEDISHIWPAGSVDDATPGIISAGGLNVSGIIDWQQNPARTATFDLTANTVTVPDSGRDFIDDDLVFFTTTGALPTGLLAGNTGGTNHYFVVNAQAVSGGNQTFKVSSSKGGSAIDISGTPSGTNQCRLFMSATSALGGQIINPIFTVAGFMDTDDERGVQPIVIQAPNVTVTGGNIQTVDVGGGNSFDCVAIRVGDVFGTLIDGVEMPGTSGAPTDQGKIHFEGTTGFATIQNCKFDGDVTFQTGYTITDGGGNTNNDGSPRTVPT